mgnify:CR=1 FL=1
MNKLFYILFGILIVGVGFYGLSTGKMPGIGTGTGSSRIVTFQNEPIEYSIQLAFCFWAGIALIKNTLFEKPLKKTKRKGLHASDFENHNDFVRLQKVEKSIRNLAFWGAILGFLTSFIIAYFSSGWLGIDPDTCVKCQENGDLWAFMFIGGIPIGSLLGYYIPLKFKVWNLLKNKTITKLELEKMNLYGSLTHHKL